MPEKQNGTHWVTTLWVRLLCPSKQRNIKWYLSLSYLSYSLALCSHNKLVKKQEHKYYRGRRNNTSFPLLLFSDGVRIAAMAKNCHNDYKMKFSVDEEFPDLSQHNNHMAKV